MGKYILIIWLIYTPTEPTSATTQGAIAMGYFNKLANCTAALAAIKTQAVNIDGACFAT